MVDEQNLFLVNDEDSDGEINFFVDVSHKLPEKIYNKTAKTRSQTKALKN